MTVDDLQQFIFKKCNEIRKRGTYKGNENPEYQRALIEVVEELSEERDRIIKSYEHLKSLKLVN